ncbi:hypothetical protein IGI42_001333 [Enterococcus sp. AZ109]
MPSAYTPWNPDKIYQAILHDKKVRGDKIHIVLVEDIGKSQIHTVPLPELKEYLLA